MVFLFLLGCFSYGLLEVLWRGYTHYSMFIAGGICFFAIFILSNSFKKRDIFSLSLVCAAVITAVEFLFGVIFNIFLKQNVWDYSALPLNFLGQISLIFSAVWWGISLALIPFCRKLKLKLEKV